MRPVVRLILICLTLCTLLLTPAAGASELALPNLGLCKEFGFSTEEDFVTQGPTPPDGSSIISDGDLLGRNHAVCARNQELLLVWKVQVDLGLDAVDIVDVERALVAFSTELNDPAGRFKSGDLLATNGVVIPNVVLLTKFQVGRDLGLDGLQFIGDPAKIIEFLAEAGKLSRDDWLRQPGLLITMLERRAMDIWISTEETQLTAATTAILDGDLLSVRTGTIVVKQADLLPAWVPAGLPARGVDFGLDAVATNRKGDKALIRFSTEILHRGEMAFTDGDVLKLGDGIEVTNATLVAPFEPKARFLGLDALHINFEITPQLKNEYLPTLFKKAH